MSNKQEPRLQGSRFAKISFTARKRFERNPHLLNFQISLLQWNQKQNEVEIFLTAWSNFVNNQSSLVISLARPQLSRAWNRLIYCWRLSKILARWSCRYLLPIQIFLFIFKGKPNFKLVFLCTVIYRKIRHSCMDTKMVTPLVFFFQWHVSRLVN